MYVILKYRQGSHFCLAPRPVIITENKVATSTTTKTMADITPTSQSTQERLTTGALSNVDNSNGSDNINYSGDEEAGEKAQKEPTGTPLKERKPTQRWNAEEDELLAELVAIAPSFKRINWTELAVGVPNRTAKQCRERYISRLKPNQIKGQWTEEEDSHIFQLQSMFGNQWSKIAARKSYVILSCIRSMQIIA